MNDKTDEPADAATTAGDDADRGNRDTSATYVCRGRGAAMIILEIFGRGCISWFGT